MPTHRKVVLLMVVALAPTVSGCLVGAVAGAGTAYWLTAPQQTEVMTTLWNQSGENYVEDAMKTWLDRGQLPLPVLPDGMHTFSLLKTDYVTVPHALGAQTVALYDRGRLIAEYVVAWDRRPLEFRVAKATNRLYDGDLDVSTTPRIQITDFPR